MIKKREFSKSVSIKNSNISGQVAIGDNNRQQKIVKTFGYGNAITSQEILKIIKEMQNLVQNSVLQDEKKSKCLRHLQTVKDETQAKEPDKEYAAKTLQKLNYLLNSTSTGDGVIDKIQPLITRMLPWLGETKRFLVI